MGNELNPEGIKLVYQLKQMASRTCRPIECANKHDRKHALPGIAHKGIQPLSPSFGSGYAIVGILGNDLEAPLLR